MEVHCTVVFVPSLGSRTGGSALQDPTGVLCGPVRVQGNGLKHPWRAASDGVTKGPPTLTPSLHKANLEAGPGAMSPGHGNLIMLRAPHVDGETTDAPSASQAARPWPRAGLCTTCTSQHEGGDPGSPNQDVALPAKVASCLCTAWGPREQPHGRRHITQCPRSHGPHSRNEPKIPA